MTLRTVVDTCFAVGASLFAIAIVLAVLCNPVAIALITPGAALLLLSYVLYWYDLTCGRSSESVA